MAQHDHSTGLPPVPTWPEVESQVYYPRWFALSIGLFFLVTGVIGFFTIEPIIPPNFPLWIARLATAIYAFLGAVAVEWAIRDMLFPTRIRHAAPGVLPEVPQEPVLYEGSTVHGRLTHELVDRAEGWELRPSPRLLRNDRRFFLGFGIPFTLVFIGLLTWGLHDHIKRGGWVGAAMAATLLALMSGGTAIGLMWMLVKASYRRLGRLTIPRDGGELQLNISEAICSQDLAEGIKWAFQGETKRQQLSIPREMVAAVQLCPWKYASGINDPTATWAVQGLLVLTSPEESIYQRLPLMLTGDFVAPRD